MNDSPGNAGQVFEYSMKALGETLMA